MSNTPPRDPPDDQSSGEGRYGEDVVNPKEPSQAELDQDMKDNPDSSKQVDPTDPLSNAG